MVDRDAHELVLRYIEERLHHRHNNGSADCDTVETLMEYSKSFAALGYDEDADLALLAALFCLPAEDEMDASIDPTLLVIAARLIRRLSKEPVAEFAVV